MGYGQDNEDDVVLAHLDSKWTSTTGRFLDIGAYDGANISNTRALRERGWGGTLVEAGVKAFCSLVGVIRNAGHTKQVELVHAVVTADRRGLSKWWERGMASTIYPHMADRASAGQKWTADEWDIFSNALVTVADLLETHPGPYHFISIDTEGDSVDLLKCMDLGRLRTEIVCIEHENRTAEVIAHCAEHGLTKQLFDNGCNIILARP